ncbi:DUF317 domain-containing protein [Streptomyces sp. NBC_01635]|nr:DUF317 domain-containing protein [Streptomyces sp. NBC_01635]WTD80117.1 DUF317 domain-containing protein [Streptomyces sp. NBC_01635]
MSPSSSRISSLTHPSVARRTSSSLRSGNCCRRSPCARLSTRFAPKPEERGQGTWPIGGDRVPFGPRAWEIVFDATTPPNKVFAWSDLDRVHPVRPWTVTGWLVRGRVYQTFVAVAVAARSTRSGEGRYGCLQLRKCVR